MKMKRWKKINIKNKRKGVTIALLSLVSIVVPLTMVYATPAALTTMGDTQEPPQAYSPTEIPTDPTQLFVPTGDLTNTTTAVVYEQGGPQESVDPTYFLQYFSGLSSYYGVAMQQAQTYNQTILQNGTGTFTFQDAQKEDYNSVLMLNDVITYLIAQGYSTIYIMAHSFGCFITQLWLQDFTIPSQVSKIVIMGGRLDMPDVVWEGFAQGLYYMFNKDQVPYVVADVNDLQEEYLKYQAFATMYLLSAAGSPRFTQTLDQVDLSKIVYVYGTEDQNVGSLTTQEVNFLISHGAQVICIPGGSHSSMYENSWSDMIFNTMIS